jgi:hypothetical protein
MDKNIAAILRDDAKTIQVGFELHHDVTTGKIYTYISHLNLVVGDFVVVPVGGSDWKVGRVLSVDDDLLIEPNADLRYAWVVDRVDVQAHKDNALRNKEIEQHLAASYRVSARQAYAMQFLGNASPEVLALVKGAK